MELQATPLLVHASWSLGLHPHHVLPQGLFEVLIPPGVVNDCASFLPLFLASVGFHAPHRCTSRAFVHGTLLIANVGISVDCELLRRSDNPHLELAIPLLHLCLDGSQPLRTFPILELYGIQRSLFFCVSLRFFPTRMLRKTSFFHQLKR